MMVLEMSPDFQNEDEEGEEDDEDDKDDKDDQIYRDKNDLLVKVI